ncbi:hypothetical protein FNV43_RR24844 [Rhamnella rubrinervis]|uniref:Delta(3)-Delta(2)-enoyl-CoA isomerase n=1 Tax=Rhamnella rubrinervis TaxID=2594499 RepID=A0A8K0DS02_9ROSA|nr:hypothetical protein FNV43_RR24844 [Rhamnella rubrinervis]
MCTLEKQNDVFILTITGEGQHRLSPALLDEIQSALRRVRAEYSSSSVLITTAHGKFFSNGFDLDWALSSPEQTLSRMILMDSKLRSVVSDLISLPMPTIAAVTGHASAAGFILALSHDYILMRSDRGFIYMSEVDIQLTVTPWFMALIKSKIGSPMSQRDMVMRAAKLTADEAVEKGIIDSAHGSADETLQAAAGLAEKLVARKWNGDVYARNRMAVLSDVLDELSVTNTRSRL